MKFSVWFGLFTLIFITTSTQANNDLFRIDKTYLNCNLVYENTGDLVHLEKCTFVALEHLNQIIIKERNRVRLQDNKEWKATNMSLNKHLELCETNALKSQKNSTIKKDIISCSFFHLRSLAYEASIVN